MTFVTADYRKQIWNDELKAMHMLCTMKSAIYVLNRKDQKRILNAGSKILNFIREFFFF